jgi:predicted PurR-regulated permease PerM
LAQVGERWLRFFQQNFCVWALRTCPSRRTDCPSCPVLIVALGQGWELALWALALVIVIQQLESNVIIPLIAGHAVRLPQAVGLFSVIAMGVLFGPLGLVVGYPLAVVCDVAVRRLYVREALGEEVEIVAEKSRSEQTIHN